MCVVKGMLIEGGKSITKNMYNSHHMKPLMIMYISHNDHLPRLALCNTRVMWQKHKPLKYNAMGLVPRMATVRALKLIGSVIRKLHFFEV